MITRPISSWYVLYVRSRQENKVNTLLQEKGFDTYLPMVKTVRQWSDRKKIIDLPLFPSYIFVNLKSEKELSKALSICGACSYIRFGNEYAKVSNEEIKKIKYLINTDGVDDIHLENQLFTKGEKYKIIYGPLEGLECEILQCDQKSKIIVRINSIQQNIVATLPKSFLRKNKKTANT